VLRVTLTSIGDAVIATDLRGRVSYMNAVAGDLTGWSPADAAGAPLDRIFRVVNEATREAVENPALRALREGVVVGLANHSLLIRRDGSEVAIDDSAAPIRNDRDEVTGCVLIFRDVANRRLVERKTAAELAAASLLASIVTSSHDAIVSKSLDGIILSWNEGAEHLFGWTSAEAVGRHISLIIPSDRLSEEDTILGRVRAGERTDHFDTVRQRRDGRLFDVSLTISPVRDADGRIVGASKIARDISAQKAAEARIRQLMGELRDADQRKDEFLATLAHELRGPLAPIRNAVAILARKGPQDPEVAWSQGVIERQIEQLSRLIDDLLDIERISRGKFVLRRERVPLEAAIDMALEAARPVVNAAGHHLSVLLPSERVVVDADPARLARVFSTLLKNAARHMQARGSINLTGSVESGAVRIHIEDTGVGFTPGAELGVGLTLVRGILALHQGSLEIRTPDSGTGTEAVVRLPLAAPGPLPERKPARAEAPEAPPLRILVADDNRDAADSLQRVLALYGHEVRVAYDGASAVSVGNEFRPRVAILDIGMPGTDGYDVARALRNRQGPGLTLVALTGWGQEADRRRSAEAGFDHHLIKPVDPQTLNALLADVSKK
jgi:PAS domain S-box-containing protein